MATGWPADADLADELGLAAGDDAARVSSANAAARADAVRYAQLDPVAGTTDASQFKGVLMLGTWWYEIRNRPEGLDSLNPMASPYIRMRAFGIVAGGKLTIA